MKTRRKKKVVAIFDEETFPNLDLDAGSDVPTRVETLAAVKGPIRITRADDRIPPSGNGDRGGYVRIHHEGSVPLTARFIDVDTTELVVIDDLERGPEITQEAIEGRFVKVAPRIPVSERDAFDGAAIAKVLRGKGARAVVLAPIMVGEVRRVEPEQIMNRTPRETVKAWFDEQKAIDAPSRDAALELVFGFMDEESM